MSESNQQSWKKQLFDVSNYKRNLPHIEQVGATYYTTSCTDERNILSPEERTLAMSAIRYHDVGKIRTTRSRGDARSFPFDHEAAGGSERMYLHAE